MPMVHPLNAMLLVRLQRSMLFAVLALSSCTLSPTKRAPADSMTSRVQHEVRSNDLPITRGEVPEASSVGETIN